MFVIDAFKAMYPEKFEGRYQFDVKYSGHFKGYNANVKYTSKKISFSLSKEWEHVDKDIKIGLIQSLFNKVFKTKINTVNIDLYELFLKNIHLAVPKDNVDIFLKESFNRVNDEYFNGMITMPNLIWGQRSIRKLGSYDYGTDTISISKVLEDDSELLDFVMYHEMLHKKFKYNTKNGKSFHHTPEFKRWEKKFENYEELEKRLGRVGLKRRIKKPRLRENISDNDRIINNTKKRIRNLFDFF